MPVNLHDKMAETATVTVPWGNDTVEVSYRPNVVTPSLLDEVDAAAAKDDGDALGTLLEPVLDWWDVLGEDGQRLPTDRATIRLIPMRFLVAVQSAIIKAQNPPDDGNSFGG